jgi:thioredoxin 1
MRKLDSLGSVCLLVAVGLLVGCGTSTPCVIPQTDRSSPDIGMAVILDKDRWDIGDGDEDMFVTDNQDREYNVVATVSDSGCVAHLQVHVEGGRFRDSAAIDLRGDQSKPVDQMLGEGTLEPTEPGKLVRLWATAEDYHRNSAKTAYMTFVIRGGVVEVTDETFEGVVMDSEVPVLLEYYTEWCSYCQQMKPVLEKLASNYFRSARIAMIDAEHNSSYVTVSAIQGYPTLVIIVDGQPERQYNGYTDYEELRYALEDFLD